MAISRIPSGWDYAAEGIDSYAKARKEKADKDRADKLQEFSILNQLYNSGAIGADQLNQGGIATGIPSLSNIGAIPNQAERRNDLLKPSQPYQDVQHPTGIPLPRTPDLTKLKSKAETSMTDTQAEAAGLTGPTERATRVSQGRTAAAQAGVAEQNLAANPTNISLEQTKATDSHFKDAGQRFVSKYIDPATIKASDRARVVDSAFNDYKNMRKSSAMGNVPDEAYARQFFDEAYTDALREKQKQDIEVKVRLGTQLSPDEKMYAQITNRINSLQNEMADWVTTNPLLKVGIDPTSNDPAVKRYLQLRDLLDRLNKAQELLLDPKLRKIIDVKTPAAAAPPIPAPKVDNSFEGKVNSYLTKLPPVTDIVSFNKNLAYIKDAVGKSGGITKDEAAAIEKKVREQWAKVQANGR